MYTTQSRIHRRWMGSHTLIGVTLLADLIGAGLTYLAGGILIPFLQSVAIWLMQLIVLLWIHLKHTLQPDLTLFLCIGIGTFIGLLLALEIGEVFNDAYSPRHAGRFGKALIAFVSTLLAAFFCWILLAQFLHRAPILWPPAVSFPAMIQSTPGAIWLLYYLAIHGYCALTASGQAITIRGQCQYRYDLTAASSSSNEMATTTPQGQQLMLVGQVPPSVPPSWQASTPVSRGYPGGPKWGHIESCYALYRKTLSRFDPQPFQLKTPDGFRYYEGEGQQIYWYKHTLLIPKEFLNYTWRHALLPELARQLMYYNASDLSVFEFLNSYPRSAQATFLLFVTLNFLWVPTLVKNIAGERWQGERVLDSDIYACFAGEAMRLRTRLRAEQEALQREGLADSSFPTLDERIEQINAFINEEARQLRELGYAWDTSHKTSPRLAVNPVSSPPSNIKQSGGATTSGDT